MLSSRGHKLAMQRGFFDETTETGGRTAEDICQMRFQRSPSMVKARQSKTKALSSTKMKQRREMGAHGQTLSPATPLRHVEGLPVVSPSPDHLDYAMSTKEQANEDASIRRAGSFTYGGEDSMLHFASQDNEEMNSLNNLLLADAVAEFATPLPPSLTQKEWLEQNASLLEQCDEEREQRTQRSETASFLDGEADVALIDEDQGDQDVPGTPPLPVLESGTYLLEVAAADVSRPIECDERSISPISSERGTATSRSGAQADSPTLNAGLTGKDRCSPLKEDAIGGNEQFKQTQPFPTRASPYSSGKSSSNTVLARKPPMPPTSTSGPVNSAYECAAADILHEAITKSKKGQHDNRHNNKLSSNSVETGACINDSSCCFDDDRSGLSDRCALLGTSSIYSNMMNAASPNSNVNESASSHRSYSSMAELPSPLQSGQHQATREEIMNPVAAQLLELQEESVGSNDFEENERKFDRNTNAKGAPAPGIGVESEEPMERKTSVMQADNGSDGGKGPGRNFFENAQVLRRPRSCEFSEEDTSGFIDVVQPHQMLCSAFDLYETDRRRQNEEGFRFKLDRSASAPQLSTSAIKPRFEALMRISSDPNDTKVVSELLRPTASPTSNGGNRKSIANATNVTDTSEPV